MVYSTLLRDKEVWYAESSELDKEDQDHKSALYEIDILGEDYVVALGVPRMQYADKGMVYYPIYLMSPKLRIKAKIGVFEVETAKTITVVDDDGDVDLNKLGDPVLFSFVTTAYLEKHGTHGSAVDDETPKNAIANDDERIVPSIDEGKLEGKEEQGEEDNATEHLKESLEDTLHTELEKEQEEEDDEELFTIQPTKSTPEPTQPSEKVSLDDVFTKEDPLPVMPTWPTEEAEDAKKLRDVYKTSKSTQDNWVVKYMHNKEYKIQPCESNGDCLFAAIRDAYGAMGYQTTVSKLRKLLSQEVTIELYESYKEIYTGLEYEQSIAKEEMDRLQQSNASLKKQSKATKNTNQQKDILNEAVRVKQEYLTQKTQKGGADELMQEFGFMQQIQNVDDLKEFVQTSEFWADSWAISTLELLLSVKLVVLEDTEDVDSVMRCTQGNDQHPKYATYDPKHYIIVGYSDGNHYDLVSYKDKKIFTFSEVPYDLKVKVVRTCVEHNDQGYYAQIPAFRQFRKELGVPEVITKDSETLDRELFDPDLTLSFHSKSDQKKKAGYVDADSIPVKRRNEFSVLNAIPLWRRKLDDAWSERPFPTTDGKRWNSVAHYLLAVPFKDSHPEVYNEYSDDSKTDISKDLDLAKASIEKKKDKVGRHHQTYKAIVKPDTNTLEVFRKDALRGKFAKDTEMEKLLESTHMAKLMQSRRNKEPLADQSLMEVRAENRISQNQPAEISSV